MELIFDLILLTSIWTLGLTIATQPNMLLHGMRLWAEDKKSEGWGIMDAVILCHFCMPSIHSIMGYLFAWAFWILPVLTWTSIAMYPIVVCGSSILVGGIWYLFSMAEEIIHYFRNINDKEESNG